MLSVKKGIEFFNQKLFFPSSNRNVSVALSKVPSTNPVEHCEENVFFLGKIFEFDVFFRKTNKEQSDYLPYKNFGKLNGKFMVHVQKRTVLENEIRTKPANFFLLSRA